ncbi:MAG: DnaJ domain-containing protein [Oscillospiraceae bacterium]|nr:DnaJ domain-containing protein [Oscillospiraceae bacterium]
MARDPFEVLGIPRDASDDEIKSAYRKLAKRYHPDLNPGDPSAAQRMHEVNEAYERIRNGYVPHEQTAYRDPYHQDTCTPNDGAEADIFDDLFGDVFDAFENRQSSRPERPIRLWPILKLVVVIYLLTSLVSCMFLPIRNARDHYYRNYRQDPYTSDGDPRTTYPYDWS